MATKTAAEERRDGGTPVDLTRFRAPALILGITWALYARVLDYDWTWLDDKVLILDKQDWLSKSENVYEAFSRTYFANGDGYYRPLVTVSYVLDTQWSAGKPFGFHFTNLLLHSAAALLLFYLLKRLKIGEWLAGFATALFAVHPALVETVAWIPGRNDSLLTIFSLAALLTLARDVEKPSRNMKIAHLSFFAAALLTKETAVALPLVMLAFLAWAENRRDLLKARWMWAGWLGLLVIYFIIRSKVVISVPGEGAERVKTFLHQLPVIVASLGKLVLPVHLAPIAIARDTPIWPGVLAIIALGGLAYAVEGAKRPLLLFAVAVIVVPLLPGLFIADKLTLENRLYLPAVGLVGFVAEIGRALNLERRVAATAAAALLGVSAFIAFRYQPTYLNRADFTRAAVEASPHSSLAHLQRGIYYQQIEHNIDRAAAEYEKAIESDTTEPMAHNNLGVVRLNELRFADAENEFRAELTNHPGTAIALYNLGLSLRDQGRVDEAAAAFEETLRYNPDHVDAMGELLHYYSVKNDQPKVAYYMQEMSKRGVQFVSPGNVGPMK